MDFGLSFNEEEGPELTLTGEALDNHFISLPERRGPQENKRDPRSDLTGMSAILLYCLTACKPRNLRDSQDRPPHRVPSYTLDSRVSDPVKRALLNALFDRAFRNEIDSRFQTLDELESRIHEIMKPGAEIPKQDLETLVRSEAEALFRSDRKTQLSVYRGRCANLMQAIQTRQGELLNSIQKYRRFEFGISNSPPKLHLPDGFDAVGLGFSLEVSVVEHSLRYSLGYCIGSQGEECSLLRNIEKWDTMRPPTQRHVVEQWILCQRFHGEQNPDLDLAKSDFEATLGRVIQMLSAEIRQSANQPIEPRSSPPPRY